MDYFLASHDVIELCKTCNGTSIGAILEVDNVFTWQSLRAVWDCFQPCRRVDLADRKGGFWAVSRKP